MATNEELEAVIRGLKQSEYEAAERLKKALEEARLLRLELALSETDKQIRELVGHLHQGDNIPSKVTSTLNEALKLEPRLIFVINEVNAAFEKTKRRYAFGYGHPL